MVPAIRIPVGSPAESLKRSRWYGARHAIGSNMVNRYLGGARLGLPLLQMLVIVVGAQWP